MNTYLNSLTTMQFIGMQIAAFGLGLILGAIGLLGSLLVGVS